MTEPEIEEYVYNIDSLNINDLLQCRISDVHYSFKHKTALLFLPLHNRPDMRGAIAFSKRIDKLVRQVQVYENSQLLCVYIKQKGEWGNEWIVRGV